MGVAIDAESNVYIVGQTLSDAFPSAVGIEDLERGGLDAFVTKLNPKGEKIYSVYLGGEGDDVGNDVVVDDRGNAYVTGRGGREFPITTKSIELISEVVEIR